MFWATYEQQGNTLALWADANTNRHILGPDSWEVPATWFQAVNPALIFILTPFITMFWARQSRRKKEPSSIAKMSLACLMLSGSYLLMIPAALASAKVAGGLVSMWWLIGNTFLMTIGELYLSPVGLSLVTKVAPARMVSMMMGVWFLSSFVGNYLCGFLGTFWNKIPKEMFFLLLAVLTAVTGLGIFLVLKPLKRALHSEHAPMDL
ncbi:MAG: oligopeptide:H+ symporter [Kiritimatiellaeota bacterium]|nr:oligopeptide:H+ symporter [Kiritimatiellota bacterium]